MEVRYYLSMADIFRVRWSKKVVKQLNNIPTPISRKFYAWVSAIELAGIISVRRSPGFHDEPLKGNRKGERSVRLNQSYRAIYQEGRDGKLEIIEVLEVTNHEY